MRALLTFMLCVLVVRAGSEQTIRQDEVFTIAFAEPPREDLFSPVFEIIESLEGYYVNNPNDFGKETYAGITKRDNPNWEGWKFIKQEKKKGKIKWNKHFPELDSLVKEHYRYLWQKEPFEQINDSELRAFVFDFRIHSSYSITLIQRSLQIKKTGILDSLTVAKLNSLNSVTALENLKKERLNFYYRLVKKHPTLKEFIKNWRIRVESFKHENSIKQTRHRDDSHRLFSCERIVDGG